MAAYIVGLIIGAITTVFPLIYWMNYERCIALVLAHQPDFDVAGFPPAIPDLLASSVTIIGAVVLLVSTMMIAITGLRQLKPAQEASTPPPTGENEKQKKEKNGSIDTEEETEI